MDVVDGLPKYAAGVRAGLRRRLALCYRSSTLYDTKFSTRLTNIFGTSFYETDNVAGPQVRAKGGKPSTFATDLGKGPLRGDMLTGSVVAETAGAPAEASAAAMAQRMQAMERRVAELEAAAGLEA